MNIKSKLIVRKKEVPENMAIEEYILRTTGIKDVIRQFPAPESSLIDLKTNYSQELKSSVISMANSLNSAKYRSEALREIPDNYEVIPLTYNPSSKSPSLASPVPLSNMEEKKGPGMTEGKDSELDTLSINKLSSFILGTPLEDLLNKIPRTIVRSKIVIHRATMEMNDPRAQLMWHRDGSIFFNLRLLIPIQSSANFGMEYVSSEGDEKSVACFNFLEDHLYAVDTHRPHRYFSRQISGETRIGLVIGVSPWFDYDPEAECWRSNEFYGEVHPLDMIKKGHVISFQSGV